MTKFNNHVQELYRGRHLFCRTLSQDASQCQIFTKYSISGKAPFLPAPGGDRKARLRGGGLTPPAFPACPAHGPRKSPPMESQVLACQCLQHVLETRVLTGVKSICLPRDLGDGYTGEEEAYQQSGGEDHVLGQILLAGFPFCLGW